YLAWREEGDVGAFATMAPSVRSHRQHQCLRLKSAIGVSDVACLARYIATGQPTILAVGPQPCGHLPMAILPPIHAARAGVQCGPAGSADGSIPATDGYLAPRAAARHAARPFSPRTSC